MSHPLSHRLSRRLSRRQALTPDRPPKSIARLPGSPTVEELDNGLAVCLLRNPQAPLVTTALGYRAGTRDEVSGHGGTAHFLEHMMFKGSAGYRPGEIDRRTQNLGGDNNAFTSHDRTVYYFNFAADRWAEALAIEADRMAGLTLDPREVDSERQVILEEIAMYEADPWDSLDQRVQARLFGDHPYGRPVLGTAPELRATGSEELAAFHGRFYRPDNAVLVVAGDVNRGALEVVREHFGALPAGAAGRPDHPRPRYPRELLRVTRRYGEVPRLLLALPAPAASDPAFPLLQLLVSLLARGRSSRLHRALVDEGQLCSMVAADVLENTEPGALFIGLELLPGVAPEEVEEAVLRELAALAGGEAGERPLTPEELERAVRVTVADWVFDHERIHQQALVATLGLMLFDLDHTERQLAGILEADLEATAEAAHRWLRPEQGGVLGWSLPAGSPGEPS